MAHVTTTTDDPPPCDAGARRTLVRQHVFQSRGPVGQPSSSSVRRGVPRLRRVGVEVPEDQHLAGKAPFDAFAVLVQKVAECGLSAIGGDVDRHHRYSCSFVRAVAPAAVKQGAGGQRLPRLHLGDRDVHSGHPQLCRPVRGRHTHRGRDQYIGQTRRQSRRLPSVFVAGETYNYPPVIDFLIPRETSPISASGTF
jgi:hypothetical protein